MAPHARSYDRLRRGDLDSEGVDERSCLERRLLSKLTAEPWRVWRSSELERRNEDRGLAVGCRDATPHVLPDECGRDRREVRAAVVGRDVRHVSWVPMFARPGRAGLLVTPDGAQHRGVGPCHQRQHDRKDSCSEHVDLTLHAARRAPGLTARSRRNFRRILPASGAAAARLRKYRR